MPRPLTLLVGTVTLYFVPVEAEPTSATKPREREDTYRMAKAVVSTSLHALYI